MKSQEPDYYAALGVTRGASLDEIRRAYHKAAHELHPDLNKQADANELFLNVQAAYEVLSDPTRRAKYDQSLSLIENEKPGVEMNVLYSRSALVKINEPQLIYVMMELAAPAGAKAQPSPPLNVCLVLDRSTSMQGERIDTLKTSAIELVNQLRQDDTISIVSFSDRAEVLVSAGKRADIHEIEKKIKLIQTGGGTEIYRGLEAGFFEVRSRLSNNYTNHIILITDGRTYGDEGECIRIADQAAIYGIGISGLGIGSEWNDVFLDSLAARTGGSTMFISHARDIDKFLKEKFSGLGQIYAERVTFDIHVKPGVELRYAFRLSPEASPLKTTSPVRLGNIRKEPGLTFILELMVDPIVDTSGTMLMAEGQISLDIPTQASANHVLSLQLVREISEETELHPPPTRLLKAMSQLTLYRMQERANQFLAEGQLDDASRHLHNLATHLFSQGRHELARTTLQEAENIAQRHGLSDAGKKQIKYGTRALLIPASLKDSDEFQPEQGGAA